MATRASIKFSDKDGNFLANVYHHYDGYPEELGSKLLKLTDGVVVNGISLGKGMDGVERKQTFNGFGCLVASVIGGLKDGRVGNVYLYTEDDYGNCGEDYLYEVIENTEGNGVGVFVKNMDGDWEFVKDILDRISENLVD